MNEMLGRLTGKHGVRSITDEEEFSRVPGAEGRPVQERPELDVLGFSVQGFVGHLPKYTEQERTER
jgi:hypothetical protein